MEIISEGSTWREKKLFDDPDDYDAILSLIEDYEYIPCYDEFTKDDSIKITDKNR